MGRPKATYAAQELEKAQANPGMWCFYSYTLDAVSREHVTKVIRWLRNNGAEVRSLDLGSAFLVAVKVE
jgi:hypothetical protein